MMRSGSVAPTATTINMTSVVPAITAARLRRRVPSVSVVSALSIWGGIPGGDHD